MVETNKDQAIKDQKVVVTTAEGIVDGTLKLLAEAKALSKGTQDTEEPAKSALDKAKEGKVCK